jgi:UbiD family decarboxylase
MSDRYRYSDLREWLEIAEGLGELRHVQGADPELEIGGITELNAKRRTPPALLFDHIKGYQPGYRLLTGSLLTPSRVSSTLRLPVVNSNYELVKLLRGKMIEWESRQQEFPYDPVESGPVKENLLVGEDVNLLPFPAPFWHEKDGGRYLGTGCVVVTRDPETGSLNVGTYRVMLHDKNTVIIHIIPGKHGRIHLEKYHKNKKPCPIAISLGHDPLLFMLGGLEVPAGICEYNLAGAIMGERVKVVEAPITGLPVPATSEVVIEGYSPPDVFMEEGPFGEWTGYYAGGVSQDPVIQIKGIMFRKDPIILGSPPGKPPHDFNYWKCVLRSASLHDSLVKAGIPDIRGVWAHEVGGSRLFIAVSIKQRYLGHARQAGFVASQCQTGAYLGRYVVVVDEDIDPSDLQEVIWAMCTRSDPASDIEMIRRAWSSEADPLVRKGSPPCNSRAIIDACRPYEWLDEFPPVVETSPDLLRAIKTKWADVLEK